MVSADIETPCKNQSIWWLNTTDGRKLSFSSFEEDSRSFSMTAERSLDLMQDSWAPSMRTGTLDSIGVINTLKIGTIRVRSRLHLESSQSIVITFQHSY